MAQYLREIRYDKNLEFLAVHVGRRNDRSVEVFREIMKHLEKKNTHTVIELAVVDRAEENHNQNDLFNHSQFRTHNDSLRVYIYFFQRCVDISVCVLDVIWFWY